MIKSNLNLNEANGITQKELFETLEEAYEASSELRAKLSKISVKIDKHKNPELINAVIRIFGEGYVSKAGNAKITYDMYCSVIHLMRDLGKSKAKEVL